MATLNYLLLYCFYLFIPGFLIYRLLNLRNFRFLLSFSLSYSLLILTLLPLKYFRAPVHLFTIIVNAEVALLLVLLTLVFWRKQNREERNIGGFIREYFSGIVRRIRKRTGSIIIGIVLFALILGYLLYVGPYTEIPADVWEHMRRFQDQSGVVNSGRFYTNTNLSNLLFSQGDNLSGHWYTIQIYLCHISGISIAESMFITPILTVLTFCAAIFFFGMFLFSRLRITRLAKTCTSAISVLFYIATFGVSVFAYIRYYALAPTILNYVIYLTTMAVILDFIRDKTWRLKTLWLVPFFLLVMNTVHSQEVLFTYFMTLAVLLVEFFRIHFESHPGRSKTTIWKIHIALMAVLGSYISLFFFSHSKPFTWYDYRFAVPVETIIPFFRNMLIQPPWGQFYQVITLWGAFVYLLFFFKLRHFKKNVFIMGGMLIPFLTVFNPATVDMMLRLTKPDALYRLSYCLPLPFIAAWIAMDSIHRLKKHVTAVNKMFHGIILVGLIGLIFPIHTKYLEAPYSRIYTLRRIPQNDVCLWRDLMDFLCSLDKTNTRIVTDTATGYAIRGFTGIDSGNWRFYQSRFDGWLACDDPDEDMASIFKHLDLKHDWLLVINERDGALSVTGLVSGHWPLDIMNVSKCYSPKMKAYVEEHPEFFNNIWEKDRIRIYKIISPASVKSAPLSQP